VHIQSRLIHIDIPARVGFLLEIPTVFDKRCLYFVLEFLGNVVPIQTHFPEFALPYTVPGRCHHPSSPCEIVDVGGHAVQMPSSLKLVGYKALPTKSKTGRLLLQPTSP
jgi:hypothetical protein